MSGKNTQQVTDSKTEISLTTVRLYITQSQYRQLRATLALQGLSVSEWFRNRAKEEIDEPKA